MGCYEGKQIYGRRIPAFLILEKVFLLLLLGYRPYRYYSYDMSGKSDALNTQFKVTHLMRHQDVFGCGILNRVTQFHVVTTLILFMFFLYRAL